MSGSHDLLNTQITFFNYIVFISYTLYFLALFGLSSTAPKYLDVLQSWVKIAVGLFLIWRFNGFRKIQYNRLDSKIAFSAGVFLLTTSFIDQIIKNYILVLKEQVIHYM